VAKLPSDTARLAFWIDAYNAFPRGPIEQLILNQLFTSPSPPSN
jgi:hypothetical protein